MRNDDAAINELIERASLKNHPIQKAIVQTLGAVPSLSFVQLWRQTCDIVGVAIDEKNFRRAIENTNEILRLIDNLDQHYDICLAKICTVAVEVEGNYFYRYALVRN